MNILDKTSELPKVIPFSLCLLKDLLIHIDTISMKLPIVYFKGSQVEFSILRFISVPEGCAV